MFSGRRFPNGRIVYQCGADLWLLDLKTGHDAIINITLVSDFDQLRDHWVKKPLEYLTGVHIAPDGDAAVFTARGEVFTLPAKSGRIVKVAGNSGIRYREARYMPDGKSIIALSTESGETEFWKYPANGIGAPEQWTHDAKVLRWEGVPSPDGRWLAHRDKDQQLWLYDTKTKQQKRIAQSMVGDFADLTWSPDSQWLAYVEAATNTFTQIKVLNANTGAIQALTSDRYNSGSPAWSADGKWLYFLSDRMLKTVVRSPWGSRQPDPYFDRSMKVYELALTPGLRSPFAPVDELHPEQPAKPEPKPEEPKSDKAAEAKPDKSAEAKPDQAAEAKKPAPVTVNIDFTDLASRLNEVPVPPGNYSDLEATEKRLCWLDRDEGLTPKRNLACVDIANKGDPPETVLADVKGYEMSLDRKKMLVSKGEDFYILDSDVKAPALGDPKALPKAKMDLSRWTFDTNPRAEFHELFLDAWRLERDYFYDRNMQGVDWKQMRDRYLPLVDRVADRDDLNDVIAQMVSELSALHIFVLGGDSRSRSDEVGLAALGAVLRRDEQAGGYVVGHIYLHDPDLPNDAPPLARPDSMVHEGEVILSIDGEDLLGVSDERALLRGKAGRQVLLRVKSTSGQIREVIATPISDRGRAQPALQGVGVLAPAQSGIGLPGAHRLRSSAGDGLRRHRAMGARLLPRFRPSGADHRRAPQRRRQHRFLAAGQIAAPGVVLVAAPHRQPQLQHAIRVSRTHGGALRSIDRFRRRGLYRRLSPPRSGKGYWRAHVGRRDLAIREQYPCRQRDRHGRRDGCLRTRRQMAD